MPLPATPWLNPTDPAEKWVQGYGLGQRSAIANAELIANQQRMAQQAQAMQAEMQMAQAKLDQQSQLAMMEAERQKQELGTRMQLEQQKMLMEQQQIEISKAYHQQQIELGKQKIAETAREREINDRAEILRNQVLQGKDAEISAMMKEGLDETTAISRWTLRHLPELAGKGVAGMGSVLNAFNRGSATIDNPLRKQLEADYGRYQANILKNKNLLSTTTDEKMADNIQRVINDNLRSANNTRAQLQAISQQGGGMLGPRVASPPTGVVPRSAPAMAAPGASAGGVIKIDYAPGTRRLVVPGTRTESSAPVVPIGTAPGQPAFIPSENAPVAESFSRGAPTRFEDVGGGGTDESNLVARQVGRIASSPIGKGTADAAEAVGSLLDLPFNTQIRNKIKDLYELLSSLDEEEQP